MTAYMNALNAWILSELAEEDAAWEQVQKAKAEMVKA